MTLQYSTALRGSQVGAIQTQGGAAATLVFYNGTKPADANTALSGNTVLCTITLPATFLTTTGAVASLAGSWTGTGAAGAAGGTVATFFRILTSGTTAIMQGDVTSDLVLNNPSIATGQTVTVSSFAITGNNP